MDQTKKKTIKYTYKSPKLDDIERLSTYITDVEGFKSRYGNLLSLLRTKKKMDLGLLSTLLQFYDPLYHCFTFPDYQLVPTLEEYSCLIGLPILEDSPFPFTEKDPKKEEIARAICVGIKDIQENMTTKGGISGLPAGFLIKKAQYYADHLSMDAFEAILALLIYGIFLFPNIDNFVDLNAIKIFLKKNPVPTLLGSAHHSIHLRNLHKGGMIICCVPLLYKWFHSHMPKAHVFWREGWWSEKIMALSHSDIEWYSRDYDGIKIIDSCGNFGNVPLLTTDGGISYNPVLARRQLGYPLKDRPNSARVESLFFLGESELKGEFLEAWKHIHKRGKESLGKQNCVSFDPYLQWVRKRAIQLKMPYALQEPMVLKEERPLIFFSEEEKLKIALRKSQQTEVSWRYKYQVVMEENEMLRKQLQEKEEEIKASKKRKAQENLFYFSNQSTPWKTMVEKLMEEKIRVEEELQKANATVEFLSEDFL